MLRSLVYDDLELPTSETVDVLKHQVHKQTLAGQVTKLNLVVVEPEISPH